MPELEPSRGGIVLRDPADLPLAAMEARVFESRCHMILTSMHRLRTRLVAELSHMYNRPGLFPAHSLQDRVAKASRSNSTYAWVLLRRINLRTEKLRILVKVIDAKLTLPPVPNGTERVILEAARTDAKKSIADFERYDDDLVAKLCRLTL